MPSTEVVYVDFERAVEAVERVRHRSAEAGEPGTAPPFSLTDCDRNTVESALAAPRWDFSGLDPYPTLAAKAAILLYGLARSQACPDGNKRVALILVVEFLFMNRSTVSEDEGIPADKILWAAESDRADKDDVVSRLTTWFDEVIVPI